MTNSELKREAEQLIECACLPELLAAYEEWFMEQPTSCESKGVKVPCRQLPDSDD